MVSKSRSPTSSQAQWQARRRAGRDRTVTQAESRVPGYAYESNTTVIRRLHRDTSTRTTHSTGGPGAAETRSLTRSLTRRNPTNLVQVASGLPVPYPSRGQHDITKIRMPSELTLKLVSYHTVTVAAQKGGLPESQSSRFNRDGSLSPTTSTTAYQASEAQTTQEAPSDFTSTSGLLAQESRR